MTNHNRLKGSAAIAYAEAHGLTLNSHTSPVDEAREGLTVEDARLIAREDPSLIWIDAPSDLEIANAIAQDAGTKFVRSADDASWATKRCLPFWQAADIERRLNEVGIEASVAPDNDDKSGAWVWATLDEGA